MNEKKASTFLRNVYVVVIALIIMGVFWYFTKTPQFAWVSGLFNCVAYAGLVLAIKDIIDKACTDRKLLTLKYMGGMTLVFAGIGVFVWALKFTGNLDFYLRLGLAAFLGSLGYVWFNYKGLPVKDRSQSRWERVQKKVLQAKTTESARKNLYKNLKFCLANNDISSGLDLDRPLAEYKGKNLTCEDLMKNKDEGISQMREDAINYIESLVSQLDIEPEIGG